MSTSTLIEQIEELERLMDEAFDAADAAKEAGDHAEADRQYALAYAYQSKMNRRKKFLLR